MNVKELFDELQNKFSNDDLTGELILQGNCIIWTYNLDDEFEDDSMSFDLDDEEIIFGFNSCGSEELLEDAYAEDFEKIINYLDEIDEFNNWTFSDADIVDDLISFKIF